MTGTECGEKSCKTANLNEPRVRHSFLLMNWLRGGGVKRGVKFFNMVKTAEKEGELKIAHLLGVKERGEINK